MGTTKNILMQEFNGVDYDTLYPSIQPNFPNDLVNMYIWEKWKKDFTEETKILDASYLFLLGGEDKDLTMSVSDGYDFDQTTNNYYLINPTQITFSTSPTDCQRKLTTVAGKYALISGIGSYRNVSFNKAGNTQSDKVYQFPLNISDATITYRSVGNLYYKHCYYYGIESDYITGRKYTLTYYGYDLTPTHTPPTDEYSRNDLGILCDKGFYRSYVGTDTQTTLTIPVPFQPNIMLLSKDNIDLKYPYDSQFMWIRGVGTYSYGGGNIISIALDGNNLLLTLGKYNSNGIVYYYWIR